MSSWKHAEDGRRVIITDAVTGEIIDVDGYLVEKSVPRSGSNYWWRFMVQDLMDVMLDVPGKQQHAVAAILDAVSPYDNHIYKSLPELADTAGCSEKTMREAMKVMRDHHIIKMVKRGQYMIDPRFMTQGGGNRKYTSLCITYNAITDMRVIEGGRGNDRSPAAAEG